MVGVLSAASIRTTMYLRELYDRERRSGVEVGMRREEVLGLVRQIGLTEPLSTIVFTDLDEWTVEQAIDEQMAYFAGLGHEFEWKVYVHDRPADMVQRLRRRGFDVDQAEAIVALDLDEAAESLFEPTPAVRRTTNP